MNKISKFNCKRYKVFKKIKKFSYNEKTKKFIYSKTLKEYTWTEFARFIGYSVKQARRLFNKLKNCNVEDFIIHKNINNSFCKKYKDDTTKFLEDKYVEYTYDPNNGDFVPFTIADYIYWMRDELKIKDLPSDSSIYRLLSKKVVSCFAHKKTKRDFCKKKNITENELNDYVKKAIEYDQKKFKIKDQLKFGQRLEIDGCSHNWMPHGLRAIDKDMKITLHGICDSSGYMLSISADFQETNKGYVAILKEIYEKYGVPQEIRGDKRTSFQYNGLNDTVLGKVIVSFGTELNCESYGQFKPNIEGAWGIMQKWLPKYLSKKRINTIESFMEYVNSGQLTKDYNKRYKREKYLNRESAFKKLMEHEVKCGFITSFPRKVQKGNLLKINNEYWYPVNEKGERVIMNENKKHCTFDVYQNLIENTMFIKRHNQKLFLKRADQFIDFIDRNNILNAIESDDNLLIYSLEKTNNSLINKVNKLTSLIINSNDQTLIKKMNDSWLQY